MLDEKALILIAHSDGHTLMALYTLLDDEGYLVAPCFSDGELLKYCAKYQPDLVMTSTSSTDGEGDRLLETIKARSPKTKILILPDVLSQDSAGDLLEPNWSEDILRFAESAHAERPSFHRNGS